MKAGDEVRFKDPQVGHARTKRPPSTGIVVAVHGSLTIPSAFDVFFLGSLVMRNVPSSELTMA